ncbi:MAG: DUF4405 domain-containing protein [Nanoarchaeota archaeon]|nr:DUF4405 domain-containing protein [Nanoarchaeota archaeon]
MNRLKVNYWVDIGLGISFLVSFVTGLVKWPGLIKVIGPSLFGKLYFSKISWLHDWSGLIMGLLVLVHLALHWKWIVGTTKRLLGRKKK